MSAMIRLLPFVFAALLIPAGAVAQESTVLHVGSTANETYAQVYYAFDMGFFKKAGLDVEITTITSGGTVLAGVASGALDIGAASVVALINAHARGIPISVIAPAGIYTSKSPIAELIVPKDSSVRSAHDLEGKTVAVTTLRDLAQDGVMAWIDANGGASDKVQFVELAPSEMLAAVLRGRIDAAFIPEPHLSKARVDARILGAAYDGIAQQFMAVGWLSTNAWIARNPATARKFAAVMRQTGDWAIHNRKAATDILAKYSKIPVETLRDMNHATFVDRPEPALIQPVIDIAVKYKTLPKAFPAEDLFYPGLR
jgi:NitT/TauT family transport system substrate-binding protein